MIRIGASLLAANFAALGEEVKRVRAADMLHFDVMDGRFAPNFSLGPAIIQALRPLSDQEFDVHLMIERPEDHLETFARSGADAITVHAEATYHIHRVLGRIKELGLKAGISFNVATPLDCLEYVHDLLDNVLIMSVNPGFGGQQFLPQTVDKIRQAQRLLARHNCPAAIQVDGGINEKTGLLAVQAGARVLIAGTHIFSSSAPDQAISALKRLDTNP